MATVPNFVVRNLTREEIPQALDIWKETGLHEGTHCLHTWIEVDPKGIFVAVTDTDEVIGVCSAVVHREDYAFMGFYAVRRSHRGQGIGMKLWNAGTDHIGDRNAGINAVPDRLQDYRTKGGFPNLCDWYSMECQSKVFNADSLKKEFPGITLSSITGSMMDKVLDYDANVHGIRRDKIVSLTVQEPESVSLAAVEEDGRVCGYGCLKLSVQGHGQVGPLYADSQDIAEVILSKLISSFPQCNGLVMMISSKNPGGMSIIKKLGLEQREMIPGCYRGKPLKAKFEHIFGQHDLNFSPF